MAFFNELLEFIGLSKPKVGPTKKIKTTKALNQKARILDKDKKRRDKILRVAKSAKTEQFKNGYKIAYFSAVELCNEVSKRDCYHDSAVTPLGSNKISTKDLISAAKAARSLFPKSKMSFIAFPVNDLEYKGSINDEGSKPWGTNQLEVGESVEKFVRAKVNGISGTNDNYALVTWLKHRSEGVYVPFENIYIGVTV